MRGGIGDWGGVVGFGWGWERLDEGGRGWMRVGEVG